MKCPICGSPDSKVVDSRVSGDGGAIRRRRECEDCRRRFTTYERAEEFIPRVIKKDGRREEFKRSKVLEGLMRACEKRPVSIKDLEAFVDGLLAQIQDMMAHEVESVWIGEQVMAFLKSRDPIAYVRFASVYRSFADLTAFEEEIRSLIPKTKSRKSKGAKG
ncbi:MAG: transcriptional regulator NrdR [Myxococcota bacterium]|jgi:transcriptional repressor NrdR|nr:transcriptional repressor NrdR [Myxococcota bacterium]OQC43014.1 MAG: Transcriptional repressor NrdR [Deltaproteobacteria bacterium ADurb.Bin058]HHW97690.1 transcriptional repressor NrdR [Oligoflexales bacterium]HON26033.1 transcriptional regulator NrdR [Myxococcota bacterium]HOS62260.1 transcriptional regulator NrdR [Myxococcota bacterium]